MTPLQSGSDASKEFCFICQLWTHSHETFNCPDLVCKCCSRNGHSRRDCPRVVISEPEVRIKDDPDDSKDLTGLQDKKPDEDVQEDSTIVLKIEDLAADLDLDLEVEDPLGTTDNDTTDDKEFKCHLCPKEYKYQQGTVSKNDEFRRIWPNLG